MVGLEKSRKKRLFSAEIWKFIKFRKKCGTVLREVYGLVLVSINMQDSIKYVYNIDIYHKRYPVNPQ